MLQCKTRASNAQTTSSTSRLHCRAEWREAKPEKKKRTTASYCTRFQLSKHDVDSRVCSLLALLPAESTCSVQAVESDQGKGLNADLYGSRCGIDFQAARSDSELTRTKPSFWS
eukprot:3405135-Rhodomonas_salina.1